MVSGGSDVVYKSFEWIGSIFLPSTNQAGTWHRCGSGIPGKTRLIIYSIERKASYTIRTHNWQMCLIYCTVTNGTFICTRVASTFFSCCWPSCFDKKLLVFCLCPVMRIQRNKIQRTHSVGIYCFLICLFCLPSPHIYFCSSFSVVRSPFFFIQLARFLAKDNRRAV